LVERSERSEWNLYYEVKSTLSRSALAELKAGGISEIQPGIESFSTKILRDFGKGASCLQHVNLLKWCKAYAIAVTYPILFGAPTEDPADLLAMVEVIKRIEHLPPPVQMNRLRLYRGSGYWDRREEYGFTKVEPTACDQLGYGKEVTSLEDVVFNFNYTLAKHAGPAYLAAVTTLRMAISDWQRNYHRSILVSAFTAENVVITRKSSVEAHLEVIEDPVRLYILRSCEEIGRLNQICRDLELPREEFDRHISDLVDAGLLMKEGGRALTLAVPVVESRRTEDISKRGLQ